MIDRARQQRGQRLRVHRWTPPHTGDPCIMAQQERIQRHAPSRRTARQREPVDLGADALVG